MTTNNLRELRKLKSWSQRHLAQAAGVSVRTIQRMERGGNCSDESMLNIAAALDVDVAALRRAGPESAERRLARPVFGWTLEPKRAARIGAALTAPSFLFATANLLKFELGVPQPYDVLASLGSYLPILASLAASPAILVGGPAAALAASIAGLIRVWGDSDNRSKSVSILGLEMRFEPTAVLVALIALGTLAILTGYVAIENLGHLISDTVPR